MIKKYSFTYEAELIEFNIETEHVEIFKALFRMKSDEQFIDFLEESFDCKNDWYDFSYTKDLFENHIGVLLEEEASLALEVLFEENYVESNENRENIVCLDVYRESRKNSKILNI